MKSKEEKILRRSSDRMLTYNGKTQHQKLWEEELGLSCGTIHHRLKRGWTIKKALTTGSWESYAKRK